MGLIRDVSDVVRAGSLTVGAYLLPVGLGLMALASTRVPAPIEEAPREAELVVWSEPVSDEPVADEPPIDALLEEPPESVLEPTDVPAPPDRVAIARPVAGPHSRELRRAEPEPETGDAREAVTSERRSCDPSGLGGISRVGTASFVVERSVVSYYSRHLKSLDALGWVAKEEGADGKALGYRLGGIRCGSDLHLAGLRNGDVVRSVNGHRVRSLPEALLTYAKLKKADVIELEVLRKTGATETLIYTLS